ncbi:DUF418 domain-containing protein [Streptomyces flavotricini]
MPAAAYGATVQRMLAGPRGPRLAATSAPAGRMTPTDYLTQPLVLAFVFTGFSVPPSCAVSPRPR